MPVLPQVESPETLSGSPPDGQAWYGQTAAAVARRLGTDLRDGLTSQEAHRRLEEYGPNTLIEARTAGWLRLVARQFADAMVLLLVGAAGVAAVLGEVADAVAIGAILILNAVIGVVQEWRAERALQALRQMAEAEVHVLRDGALTRAPHARLVPGDVIALEAGNLVPCDARLVDASGLKADEAALTGESEPVTKTDSVLSEEPVPLGDRVNMVFRGTAITHGSGRAVAVATGMSTELGRVAQLLHQTKSEASPLQKRLSGLSRRLLVIVLVIAAVVSALGLIRGEPLLLMVLTGISLAVAAIPEALPAVATVSLALGARDLVRRNALVRRLSAVEALGSVTTICSDKTGTLTQNRMHVESYDVGGRVREEPPEESARDETWNRLLDVMALNNDVVLNDEGDPVGDPTEVALFNAAESAGVRRRKRLEEEPVERILPFDSERKRMSTLHRCRDGTRIARVKGAPEAVIPRCTGVDSDRLLQRAHAMASQGLRVLALADRIVELEQDPEEALEFLGLVGMLDPPRPEVPDAVNDCRTAGIRPVMITGDHPATARAIARRLGLLGKSDGLMTGDQIERATAAELVSVTVFARTAPEQKIRIVRALQEEGELVAMTGDGVNDAPALKAADIGVSMGRGGTDVARQASSLVLLDDNFATIVSAVGGGRRIFDNIRKFVRYALSANFGEILTLLIAGVVGLPLPLLPIHILWINLVTDGLPGVALTVEPAEANVMHRPPRPPRQSITDRRLWTYSILMGALLGGLTTAVHAVTTAGANPHGQTMVFTVLSLAQMGLVLTARADRLVLTSKQNVWLLGAVLVTIVLQIGAVYTPVGNVVLHTSPLTLAEMSWCAGLSVAPFIVGEAYKAVRRLVVSSRR